MTQTAIALLIFLFPLAYSPGPGNLFFAANAARFGFAATIPANIGYHLATWLVTAAIGWGFFAALVQAPLVFTALKIAGALYVLWIAWTLFRAGTMSDAQHARPAGFVDGGILLVLNPKAYVIIALMFTQFLPTSAEETSLNVLLITTVFTLNNLLAFLLWALIGDRIARLFRSEHSARRLNRMFGLILAGVGLWMLAS